MATTLNSKYEPKFLAHKIETQNSSLNWERLIIEYIFTQEQMIVFSNKTIVRNATNFHWTGWHTGKYNQCTLKGNYNLLTYKAKGQMSIPLTKHDLNLHEKYVSRTSACVTQITQTKHNFQSRWQLVDRTGFGLTLEPTQEPDLHYVLEASSSRPMTCDNRNRDHETQTAQHSHRSHEPLTPSNR